MGVAIGVARARAVDHDTQDRGSYPLEQALDLSGTIPVGAARTDDENDPVHLGSKDRGIGHNEGWRRVQHHDRAIGGEFVEDADHQLAAEEL